MNRTILFCVILLIMHGTGLAGALRQETLQDTRAHQIAMQLRCPVCQGETVFDSHSNIAEEMKAIIVEQIKAGKSDLEILTFFRARYGDFIIMKSPMNRANALLWFAPILIVIAAIFLTLRRLRRHRYDQTITHKTEGDIDGVLRKLNEASQ